jgi:PAS domain S-box-containing protein
MSQKKNEGSLKEEITLSKDDDLQKYFDFINGILVALNEKGEVLYINKQGCSLLGYQKKDIIGKDWFENFIPKKNHLEIKSIFNNLEIEKEKSFISRLYFPVLCKNKKKREIRWNNILLRDDSDKIICILCSGKDVSDKKQSKKDLYESAANLNAITESAHDAIIMRNSSGNITYWNTAAQNIFDYKKEEAIGENLFNLLIDKDYHILFEDALNKIINNSKPGEILESFGIKKNKNRFPIDVSISAVNLKNESHSIWIIRDITEKVQAEKDKQETWLQLLETQKLESLGRYTRMMVHDFKNILTSVVGFSGLIIEEELDIATIREYANRIRLVGEKGSSLMEGLLLFSASKLLDIKICNINKIIEKNADVITSMIGKRIKLILNIKNAVRKVFVDPSQIEHVLMNLATNAKDAILGKGCLTIETKDIVLASSYVKGFGDVIPGHYVMLSATDNGIGMTKDIQSKIFEPFFTTKDGEKNTGLGLSIIFGIIKQHNGHIVVKSKPNEGTTFEVYLPAV